MTKTLLLMAPEAVCFLAMLGFLGLCLAPGISRRTFFTTALLFSGLGILAALAAVHAEGRLFVDVYRLDLFAQVFKVLLAMGLFLVVCLCADPAGIDPRRHGEFYLLLFSCNLGMMLLVSSVHLLTVYVALELSSYSLYLLTALRRERTAGIEAGLKYFLVGILSSAVMLFGIALLYGSLQALYLERLAVLLPEALGRPLVAVGLLLTMGGFFFKLAVFPFHFWAPDVYQGAAHQVAAYIATASKVAAIAILLRIVALTAGAGDDLAHILVGLSLVSMTVGNLAAIAQTDFKRLLAYSSIAHAGYVLIGLLSMNADGYAAAMYYALAVVLLKFTCFLVLVQVARDGADLKIEGLAGLHRRSPLLALALMLALFGLAGLPPTVGFTGKLLVFTAAMERGHFILVLIAMLNVTVSLYYYLQVLRAAYLVEPGEAAPPLQLSIPMRMLTALLVVAITVAGFYPAPLVDLARSMAAYLV